MLEKYKIKLERCAMIWYSCLIGEDMIMRYYPRVIDKKIDRLTEAFNAVSKTVIEFQDEEKRDGYLSIAETAPGLFLKNEKPILFDEWQDAPKIWGMIRKACDDNPESVGEYYLTGSTSRNIDTPHTGTGRITQMEMFPMTLFETGESNGSVSISRILSDSSYDFSGAVSNLSLEELFYSACRGGWPRCLALRSKEGKLEIARDYYRQIISKDISAYDGVKRNPEWARVLLWSYARNMATTAKKNSIYADVRASFDVTDVTLASYVDVLERLYVIRDIDAWTPQIRSKTAIRAAKKHIFIDPSIAIAALGLDPDYFNGELDPFGHVFENMVLRDLMAYSQIHDAHILHYTDDMGLEADAVYQAADGRYALIEIKLGMNRIPEAEASLLRFRKAIADHNQKALANKEHPKPIYREPSALIVICGNAPMAYTTEKGIHIVPVGCLKD